jgi:uridine kinase
MTATIRVRRRGDKGRSDAFSSRTIVSSSRAWPVSISSYCTTDQTHRTLEERAATNFDHPDSLDTALLVQHVKALKNGFSVEVPTYDFTTHTRTNVTEARTPRKIILVEGILIFSDPQLVEELDMKVFVVRVFGL